MHISINTDEALSDVDKQILAVLAGGVSAPAAEAPVAKAAPAAKKAAAPKPKAKAEPEPEPEPEVEEEEAADDSDGPTLDDAKAKASALVSNGEAAKVKAALTAVGAKKVSEIDADKIADFLAELDD